MYQDIVLLIVSANWRDAEAIDTVLSPYHFEVIRANSFQEALRCIDKADVMVMDWNLPNGQAENTLASWLRSPRAGPICVVEDGLDAKQRNKLMRRACAILTRPVDPEDVLPIAQRFAYWVRGQRAVAEIAHMRRWLIILTVIVAALGGAEIVLPIIQAIF